MRTGEVLKTYPGFDSYEPWEYALLGAAAFSTGVTRYLHFCCTIYALIALMPPILLLIDDTDVCAFAEPSRRR